MNKDELIKELVNRFLCWKLPKDFYPDAGISFTPEYNAEYNAREGRQPSRHEPSGTNLFHAGQAKDMFETLLDGLDVIVPSGDKGDQKMTRKDYLDILMLISALESWAFSTKNMLPDYLRETLDNAVEKLEAEILRRLP